MCKTTKKKQNKTNVQVSFIARLFKIFSCIHKFELKKKKDSKKIEIKKKPYPVENQKQMEGDVKKKKLYSEPPAHM